MSTSQCLCLDGFVLLLVLFHSSMFGLASRVNVSYDARGIENNHERKRFLSISNHYPRKKLGESPHGKEYAECLYTEPDLIPFRYLWCKNRYIMTKINFADYGNPTGRCQHFRRGNCGAPATLRIVKKNCLGKQKCALYFTDEMFGPSHCKEAPRLAAEATCTKA